MSATSSRPQHDRSRWDDLVRCYNGDTRRAAIAWELNGWGLRGVPPATVRQTQTIQRVEPAVVTVTGWLLTTPEQCRSLNTVRDWRQRHADTQRWERAIRAELTLPAPATPPTMAVVGVTRHYAGHQRAFDFDDFVGGQKALLDSLKRLGWLKDDDPAHLQVTYTQEHSTSSQTVIRWEASRE